MQIEGHSIKQLICTLQKYPCHERKAEDLLQVKGNESDMTAKCKT